MQHTADVREPAAAWPWRDAVLTYRNAIQRSAESLCMRRLMGAALCGGLLCAGCGVWTIRLETTPPPDEVRWQGEMSAAVNDHSHRIEALERRCPMPTPTEGVTP